MNVLLDKGAELYYQDSHGWTALHHAAFNYHSDAIKLLCEYDADEEKLRYITNKRGQAPKQLSIKPGQTDVLFSLNTIWNATREAHLDVLRKVHQNGANLNQQTNKYKYTPLHLAIKANKPENYLIVKYLMDNGADPTIEAIKELGILSQEDKNNFNDIVLNWKTPIGYSYEVKKGNILELLQSKKKE